MSRGRKEHTVATETFRETKFRAESLERIALINQILTEYDGQRLTARQVYYRLVAADHIPNTPTSYKNLTGLLADARYAGLVDWDIIEDRGRSPEHGESSWELDAIPPRDLNRIVERAIATVTDDELLAAQVAEESRQRETVRTMVAALRRSRP